MGEREMSIIHRKIPGVDEAPGIIFQNGMEEPFLLCLRLLTPGEQIRISYIYAQSLQNQVIFFYEVPKPGM